LSRRQRQLCIRDRCTAVEVVTTGVLLQRLQRDPELAGVDVVVLDECHERHLDADTAAAFLLDVRAALRPELRLVAASATTDAAGWAALLGGAEGSAPVVTAAGVSYEVEVVWAPPERPVRPAHGMRVDPALLSHVAGVVRRALRERTDALVAAVRATRRQVVAVSNEVGSGVVPATPAGRRFRDELGRLNAAFGAECEQVLLVVAGQPLALRG
ncbi:hypothetical protein FNJ62_22105, partial [Streptomyces benahoarensis]